MNAQKLDYELSRLIKDLQFARDEFDNADVKMGYAGAAIVRFMKAVKHLDEVIECLK